MLVSVSVDGLFDGDGCDGKETGRGGGREWRERGETYSSKMSPSMVSKAWKKTGLDLSGSVTILRIRYVSHLSIHARRNEIKKRRNRRNTHTPIFGTPGIPGSSNPCCASGRWSRTVERSWEERREA